MGGSDDCCSILKDSNDNGYTNHGAMPSWRYDRWPCTVAYGPKADDGHLEIENGASKSEKGHTAKHPDLTAKEEAARLWWLREPFAVFVVLLGPLGAVCLSQKVQPVGVGCRPKVELIICGLYFIVYVVGAAVTTISTDGFQSYSGCSCSRILSLVPSSLASLCPRLSGS